MATKRSPAEKKAKPKVTTRVEGGNVTVSMGVRISANYNSESFDVGATLPIQPGEAENDALERTRKVVVVFFTENQTDILNTLDAVIKERKRGR